MKDIFDRLAETKDKDVFDEMKESFQLATDLSGDFADLIKEEVSKIKPKERIIEKEVPVIQKSELPPIRTLTPEQISALVISTISRSQPKTIEKVIERRIEVVAPKEKKDTRKLVEESDLKDLRDKIKELESELKDIKVKEKEISVQYIGTMIPNFNGQDGTVLTARDGKIQWEAGTSSGSGMPDLWTWEDDGTALVLKYNGSEAGRWPYP